MIYSDWDITVRELGGGIWFWTSLWLVFAFMGYVIREVCFERKVDRQILFAAGALSVYFAGSTIRGLLTWMQFFYVGNHWNVTGIVATWPWFGASVLLNITGAAMCIWLLSSWRWRVYFTIAAVSWAILVPALVWWRL